SSAVKVVVVCSSSVAGSPMVPTRRMPPRTPSSSCRRAAIARGAPCSIPAAAAPAPSAADRWTKSRRFILPFLLNMSYLPIYKEVTGVHATAEAEPIGTRGARPGARRRCAGDPAIDQADVAPTWPPARRHPARAALLAHAGL